MVFVEMTDDLAQVELDDLVAKYGDVPAMKPQGVPLDVLASSVNREVLPT